MSGLLRGSDEYAGPRTDSAQRTIFAKRIERGEGGTAVSVPSRLSIGRKGNHAWCALIVSQRESPTLIVTLEIQFVSLFKTSLFSH